MGTNRYIIRGGVEGRERLRVLSRVMQPSTHALLVRAGIEAGMACLDIGCGGGDVAFDMARMVGAAGRVVGTDIDHEKLKLARQECAAQGLENAEFLFADITRSEIEEQFDFVHARFVLTHLAEPGQALVSMKRALRPGGVIAVQDIDFRGSFCEPECAAFRRYVELYTETARRRGADANIGPQLPGLLSGAGFEHVRMHIVQPAGTSGDVKLIAPLTMENIADAVMSEGLAGREEIDRVVAELYEYARSEGTVGGLPRIVEAWGRKG